MTKRLRRRVLVIDDNEAMADNLKEVLEDAGYEVNGAPSVAAARVAARSAFDAALVDIKLPDGDGTSLAAELKERSPDSEVVLLTGFASVETAAAAVRAGAWAYLVKPYDIESLLQTLSQAIRHIELREEKRDLARRAEIAERLALAGTMTAGLSHEIKNPLNAAGLQLTLLERRIKQLGAEAQPALLAPLVLVRDEIQRLNRILDDFLQFARPRHLAAVRIDAKALIRRVMTLLLEQAAEKAVVLHEELADELAIHGEDERLQQVLMNLLLNAIQATPAKGAVQITTEAGEDGAWVFVHIDDSGPGVPEVDRRRIFEPFFTTKHSGSGLGLPIVHAIVAQHGGYISVDDSPLGGARFTLQLPRAR